MNDSGEQVSMDSSCPRCGGTFVCGSVAGTPDCWCAGLPVLQDVGRETATQTALACYCAICLRELLAAQGSQVAQGVQVGQPKSD
jgi:hypothetical protein